MKKAFGDIQYNQLKEFRQRQKTENQSSDTSDMRPGVV